MGRPYNTEIASSSTLVKLNMHINLKDEDEIPATSKFKNGCLETFWQNNLWNVSRCSSRNTGAPNHSQNY